VKCINDYKKELDMSVKLGKVKAILSIVAILLIMCAGIITACNYNTIDLTYAYDYAYIELQNGEVVEGKVTSWRDFEDGDQLQITVEGKTYLVHSSNCTLVKYGNQL